MLVCRAKGTPKEKEIKRAATKVLKRSMSSFSESPAKKMKVEKEEEDTEKESKESGSGKELGSEEEKPKKTKKGTIADYFQVKSSPTKKSKTKGNKESKESKSSEELESEEEKSNKTKGKKGSKAKEEEESKLESESNLVDYLTDSGWRDALAGEFEKPYFKKILKTIETDKQHGAEIYPPESEIFTAFNLTPLDSVKVVILGQDPYHDTGQAHGLAFSVRKGVKIPPSLRYFSRFSQPV